MRSQKRPRDKRKRLGFVLALFLLVATPALAAAPTNGFLVPVPTGTPVELGSHDDARISVCWLNLDGTNPIYCSGSSAVTSSTGFPFSAAGPSPGFCVESCQAISCGAQSPIYCVSTGGTVSVGVWETR